MENLTKKMNILKVSHLQKFPQKIFRNKVSKKNHDQKISSQKLN